MAEKISLITVKGNRLSCGKLVFSCSIGKNGFSADKHEGDGCTPLGVFPMRECWYRADKLAAAPKTGLALRITNEEDGWCDEPASPNYNRPVKLPYSFSHEMMWREDDVYDIVVPLGYNDDPVVPGKGSAIFMHIAREGYEGTEGCVALKLADMLALLALCDSSTLVEIVKP